MWQQPHSEQLPSDCTRATPVLSFDSEPTWMHIRARQVGHALHDAEVSKGRSGIQRVSSLIANLNRCINI